MIATKQEVLAEIVPENITKIPFTMYRQGAFKGLSIIEAGIFSSTFDHVQKYLGHSSLAIGEAYISGWREMGVSSTQRRTAITALVNRGLITTRREGNNTIAKLTGDQLIFFSKFPSLSSGAKFLARENTGLDFAQDVAPDVGVSYMGSLCPAWLSDEDGGFNAFKAWCDHVKKVHGAISDDIIQAQFEKLKQIELPSDLVANKSTSRSIYLMYNNYVKLISEHIKLNLTAFTTLEKLYTLNDSLINEVANKKEVEEMQNTKANDFNTDAHGKRYVSQWEMIFDIELKVWEGLKLGIDERRSIYSYFYGEKGMKAMDTEKFAKVYKVCKKNGRMNPSYIWVEYTSAMNPHSVQNKKKVLRSLTEKEVEEAYNKWIECAIENKQNPSNKMKSNYRDRLYKKEIEVKGEKA